MLKDRVAIITGVGHPRGIGRGIALAFAREGADLVLADIDGEGAGDVAREVRAMGRGAIAVRTDVSSEHEVRAMVDATLKEYDRIDVLVNNAGVSRHHGVLEISAGEWDWLLAVNLRGPFLCTRAVLPTMIEQRYGRIVFTASTAGKFGAAPRRGAHYAASKGGVIGLARTVARQYARHGITSNAVAPGYIDTDLARGWETPEETARRRRAEGQAGHVPLGRLGVPGDVAEVIVFLASEGASYVTGEVLDVNGGQYID